MNGQKVWTSSAHVADVALSVCRTDPDVPKHQGLTTFLVDMHAPGVEVRPLRQMTGTAGFNEVFLTDVRVPDSHGWATLNAGFRVILTTLGTSGRSPTRARRPPTAASGPSNGSSGWSTPSAIGPTRGNDSGSRSCTSATGSSSC